VWRILLLILVLSCHPDNKEKTEFQTNIFLLKKLFNIQQSLDSVVTDNADLKVRLQLAKDNTRSVIEGTLGYKEAVVEAKYLNAKLEDIIKEKNEIVKEEKKLRQNNEDLLRENDLYKTKLHYEVEEHKITTKERNKAQATVDELSKLKINSFNTIGLGTMTTLFGNTRYYETNKESKIKVAKVSFTLPRNPIADKEKKIILVTIYSTDKKDILEKDTTVNYIGDEMPITMLMRGKLFKVGEHLVSIRINGKFEIEKQLTITK
jgi:hypothetical protein